MPATVILGAQWGNEGKEKIVDALAKDADIVVRFQGGADESHTVVIDGEPHATRLLPSGIFREGMMNLVGPGVVFDPSILVKEIELAKKFGSHIMLDRSASIVLPMHRMIDAARKRAAGQFSNENIPSGSNSAIGDFWLRRGLTLGDLRSRDAIRSVLERANYWSELWAIASVAGGGYPDFRDLDLAFNPLHVEDTIDWLLSIADQMIPFLGDTRAYVHKALAQNKRVLFEGTHGVMLDAFHGSRPFATSSLCTAAGVSASFGVYTFDRVIGVAKAYVAREDDGPFKTELLDERGDELRRHGHEFDATTGRPRRCGWLDLPSLRYACQIGGITELAITKLDALSDFPRRLYACTRYYNVRYNETLTQSVLVNAEPELKRQAIWKDLSDCSRDHVPAPLRAYLDTIQEVTRVSVTGFDVGAKHNQILWR